MGALMVLHLPSPRMNKFENCTATMVDSIECIGHFSITFNVAKVSVSALKGVFDIFVCLLKDISED